MTHTPRRLVPPRDAPQEPLSGPHAGESPLSGMQVHLKDRPVTGPHSDALSALRDACASVDHAIRANTLDHGDVNALRLAADRALGTMPMSPDTARDLVASALRYVADFHPHALPHDDEIGGDLHAALSVLSEESGP